MTQSWKFIVLGIIGLTCASSVEAASHKLQHNGTGFFWSDNGFRAMNGRMWFVDVDKDHKKPKKKQKQQEVVQKEENNTAIIDLDILQDNHDVIDNTGNPPPFIDENPVAPNVDELFVTNDSGNSGNDAQLHVLQDNLPAVPLPPAAWAGLATLLGAGWTMRKKQMGV